MRDAPLREGLLLAGGLALLIWPLVLVTGQAQAPATEVVAVESSQGQWITDVTVQAAHAFDWMELRRGEEVLGRVEGPTKAGEFECLLERHGEILIVAAQFVEGSPESALKLELWAGAMPEVVLNLWGEGEIFEEVEVKFHE
ncbi:hypothetical protein [Roseibacillus ishigakijimensis]|uniref:Uncharacterized protein n=1 Tax=Roseibacillus ishigakijimensis TaxID=454146 RepID=A0A934RT99_9BACT|nr:hypothetical protein [Roseibacillus ishigakijimensis]MBK1835226.1 hypothetical protein [Roseibacillus ishigakijimensis]